MYISSNSRNLVQFLTILLLTSGKEKGGKPDRKPYPLPYGLRNIKSENSEDYAQKPQRNCTLVTPNCRYMTEKP